MTHTFESGEELGRHEASSDEQPHEAAPVAEASAGVRRSRPLRVMHVITGLGPGGAETMLLKLVAATRATRLTHSVVSLTDLGFYGAQLRSEGVPVTCLGMRPGVPDPRPIVSLALLLRRERPDVIQGWMYHANLVAGVAAAMAGRIPVVWGIHCADADPRARKRLTRWTRAIGALLSGVVPSRIVCCADAALRAHAAVGYRSERMRVIPNGFETDRLERDPRAGARIRRELSISEEAPVVGLIARFDPDKDHRNFLAAARLVSTTRPDAVFVLAGLDIEWSNSVLARWVDEFGLRARVRLLGFRDDVHGVLSAIDVLASSSRSEAFPNVLGEAIACGALCAVTDCGDSRDIVGESGRVVPPSNPEALAGAILELIALSPFDRAALARVALKRLRAKFEMREIAERYASLYEEVLRVHSA